MAGCGHAQPAFNLYQHTNLLIDALEVIRHGAVAVVTLRHRNTAHTLGRITGGGYRSAGLLGSFNERH